MLVRLWLRCGVTAHNSKALLSVRKKTNGSYSTDRVHNHDLPCNNLCHSLDWSSDWVCLCPTLLHTGTGPSVQRDPFRVMKRGSEVSFRKWHATDLLELFILESQTASDCMQPPGRLHENRGGREVGRKQRWKRWPDYAMECWWKTDHIRGISLHLTKEHQCNIHMHWIEPSWIEVKIPFGFRDERNTLQQHTQEAGHMGQASSRLPS